jgi:uncharacterized damage-inducible protein DinB
MPLGASLIPEFDQEMAQTRKTLARIPNGKFTFQPHPKSMPLGKLASHIAEMAGWLDTTLKTDSLDLAPPGGPRMEPANLPTIEAVLALFDASVQSARAGLVSITDEAMMTTWTLLMGGQTVFAMPRIAVVRGMILNHLVHHRGQLTVYLRMNDLPVPAIYGPSADEQ